MAAGLTQAQLAERATLSVRGISDLERGINRTPRSYTIGRLAETLALSPAERARFLGAAMREAPAIYQTATPDELDLVGGDQGATPVLRIVRQASPMLTPSPPSQRHHLPAEPTHFIGRGRALWATTRLLEDNHLLTLVGPPGARARVAWRSTSHGKWRRAIAMASIVCHSRPSPSPRWSPCHRPGSGDTRSGGPATRRDAAAGVARQTPPAAPG